LQPADAVGGRLILAIHGDGFACGSAATHRPMFGHLAWASGVPAFVVEYGLMPKQVYLSSLTL